MRETSLSESEQSGGTAGTSVDPDEVARFSALADQWWDQTGPFRPLHKFNPARLAFVRDQLCSHFGRDATVAHPLNDLHLLDIGCGGGLLSEPMARLGARVMGADASAENIGSAQAHATAQGLQIDYRQAAAEQLAETGECFDAILNMEVVEHVTNPAAYLANCAELLRPGGIMLIGTLNRTLKSYALAIVGAEYVLGWVPRGTHDWQRFIKPAELIAMIEESGLHIGPITGVTFNPLRDRWALSADTDVNYMLSCVKPG